MDDREKRTQEELEGGLKKIVSDYQIARSRGNHELAEKLKKCIEDIIRARDLDADTVYGYTRGKTVPIRFSLDENHGQA